MGVLNDLAASVWHAWQRVNARSRFQQLDPAETSHSSTRIVYIPKTEAGVRVSEDTALTYAAVFACVRIIAETMGSLSWHVFRQRPNGGKERVPGIVEFLLRDQPNQETTAFSWREQMVASALLWGGGFSEIVRDGAGRVVELWQIAPDRVQIDRVNGDGRLIYDIDNRTQGNTVLEAEDCFHLHGLGFDGITGYSVVRLAARSIGIGMASEQYAGAFYGNGTVFGTVLEAPGPLSQPARDNLRESWEAAHRGSAKAFRTAVLEEGIKANRLAMPMTDAQFLESRKFQVNDIARWFRVPPHKLADLERATFSNIEHQALEFVQDTVLPWAVRLEQEANRKLFGQNRQGFFTKLNLNALLRGDAKSRFDAYATGRQWGWLSANDIRELEDMNPIGAQGDVYLAPVNMVNAKQFVGATAPPPPPQIGVRETEEDEEPMSVLRAAHRDLIAYALERVAKREQKWAESAKRKFDGAELAATVMGFLTSDGHQAYASDAIMPPLLAFARIVFAGQVTERVESVLHDMVELSRCERLVEAQEQLLTGSGTIDAKAEADRLISQVIQLRMTLPAAAA